MSKLSESEIINKLKERIRIDRSMRLNVESDFDRFCEEECRAIEGLIDLYNKEKEKNKELEDKLKRKRYIYNTKTDEIKEIPIDNNYISKDKIEEKIETLESILYRLEDDLSMDANKYDTINELNIQIDILQELLEERD